MIHHQHHGDQPCVHCANAALTAEVERLRSGMTADNDVICQVLGRALGYPWFEDDPKNFPGATESNGVCVGDHVAVTLAVEAAQRVAALTEEVAVLTTQRDGLHAEVAELRQRDRLISNQLERRADGMDPLAVHLRAEVAALTKENAQLRAAKEPKRGYANQNTSASEEPPR